MTNAKSYSGGCHCGRVRFEFTADLSTIGECNCSICSRRGYLLKFAKPGEFKLLQGKEELSDYQFGKKSIHHLFCRICGVAPFASSTTPDGGGGEGFAVNVRCIDGIDLSTLTIRHYDGKRL